MVSDIPLYLLQLLVTVVVIFANHVVQISSLADWISCCSLDPMAKGGPRIGSDIFSPLLEDIVTAWHGTNHNLHRCTHTTRKGVDKMVHPRLDLVWSHLHRCFSFVYGELSWRIRIRWCWTYCRSFDMPYIIITAIRRCAVCPPWDQRDVLYISENSQEVASHHCVNCATLSSGQIVDTVVR